MAVLRSTRYPGLVLRNLGVRFTGGLLVTDDPRVVAFARRLGRLGVVLEDDEQVGRVERGTPPRGNASRAEWVEYAGSLGVPVVDGMTRAEIRAAVAGVGGGA